MGGSVVAAAPTQPSARVPWLARVFCWGLSVVAGGVLLAFAGYFVKQHLLGRDICLTNPDWTYYQEMPRSGDADAEVEACTFFVINRGIRPVSSFKLTFRVPHCAQPDFDPRPWPASYFALTDESRKQLEKWRAGKGPRPENVSFAARPKPGILKSGDMCGIAIRFSRRTQDAFNEDGKKCFLDNMNLSYEPQAGKESRVTFGDEDLRRFLSPTRNLLGHIAVVVLLILMVIVGQIGWRCMKRATAAEAAMANSCRERDELNQELRAAKEMNDRLQGEVDRRQVQVDRFSGQKKEPMDQPRLLPLLEWAFQQIETTRDRTTQEGSREPNADGPRGLPPAQPENGEGPA